MLVISLAAMIHLRLLSALICAGILFLSALKMAAWCKQIVDVCIFMLQKTMFASPRPVGNRKCAGNDKDVLSNMLSRALCLFQNSPFRSWSLSSGFGR